MHINRAVVIPSYLNDTTTALIRCSIQFFPLSPDSSIRTYFLLLFSLFVLRSLYDLMVLFLFSCFLTFYLKILCLMFLLRYLHSCISSFHIIKGICLVRFQVSNVAKGLISFLKYTLYTDWLSVTEHCICFLMVLYQMLYKSSFVPYYFAFCIYSLFLWCNCIITLLFSICNSLF